MNVILERNLLSEKHQREVIDLCIENDDNLFVVSDIRKLKLENEPTLAFCSLPFSRNVLATNVYPGVYCDLNLMKCSSYYSRYKDLLLNYHSARFLPYGMLRDHLNFIFSKSDDAVFVRPDSGFKSFTGMVLNCINFKKELELINKYVDHDSMCLVCDSYSDSIMNEYRFFICGNEVVSGSAYIINNEIKERRIDKSAQSFSSISDKRLFDFAERVVSTHRPERCFSLDIVEMKDKSLRLLEINSFSCAGFYDCDIRKILQKARIQAVLDWEDVYK